jgi:hypothetical protein
MSMPAMRITIGFVQCHEPSLKADDCCSCVGNPHNESQVHADTVFGFDLDPFVDKER